MRIPHPHEFIALGGTLLAAGALTGCTTIKTTTTARTATEQLLLSTASDHALHDIGLQMLAARRVYLDATYFDSYDPKYVVGTVRDALSRAGALIVPNRTNSDVVVEARSGALAIDEATVFFGIPAITLPIPLSGPVQTPEIAFYKAQKQRSTAKFALLAYNLPAASHIYSSGPLDGQSFDSRFRLFFISWHRTDIPEKQLTTKSTRQRQTWFPQYDPANLPPPSSMATKPVTK